MPEMSSRIVSKKNRDQSQLPKSVSNSSLSQKIFGPLKRNSVIIEPSPSDDHGSSQDSILDCRVTTKNESPQKKFSPFSSFSLSKIRVWTASAASLLEKQKMKRALEFHSKKGKSSARNSAGKPLTISAPVPSTFKHVGGISGEEYNGKFLSNLDLASDYFLDVNGTSKGEFGDKSSSLKKYNSESSLIPLKVQYSNGTLPLKSPIYKDVSSEKDKTQPKRMNKIMMDKFDFLKLVTISNSKLKTVKSTSMSDGEKANSLSSLPVYESPPKPATSWGQKHLYDSPFTNLKESQKSQSIDKEISEKSSPSKPIIVKATPKAKKRSRSDGTYQEALKPNNLQNTELTRSAEILLDTTQYNKVEKKPEVNAQKESTDRQEKKEYKPSLPEVSEATKLPLSIETHQKVTRSASEPQNRTELKTLVSNRKSDKEMEQIMSDHMNKHNKLILKQIGADIPGLGIQSEKLKSSLEELPYLLNVSPRCENSILLESSSKTKIEPKIKYENTSDESDSISSSINNFHIEPEIVQERNYNLYPGKAEDKAIKVKTFVSSDPSVTDQTDSGKLTSELKSQIKHMNLTENRQRYDKNKFEEMATNKSNSYNYLCSNDTVFNQKIPSNCTSLSSSLEGIYNVPQNIIVSEMPKSQISYNRSDSIDNVQTFNYYTTPNYDLRYPYPVYATNTNKDFARSAVKYWVNDRLNRSSPEIQSFYRKRRWYMVFNPRSPTSPVIREEEERYSPPIYSDVGANYTAKLPRHFYQVK